MTDDNKVAYTRAVLALEDAKTSAAVMRDGGLTGLLGESDFNEIVQAVSARLGGEGSVIAALMDHAGGPLPEVKSALIGECAKRSVIGGYVNEKGEIDFNAMNQDALKSFEGSLRIGTETAGEELSRVLGEINNYNGVGGDDPHVLDLLRAKATAQAQEAYAGVLEAALKFTGEFRGALGAGAGKAADEKTFSAAITHYFTAASPEAAFNAGVGGAQRLAGPAGAMSAAYKVLFAQYEASGAGSASYLKGLEKKLTSARGTAEPA